MIKKILPVVFAAALLTGCPATDPIAQTIKIVSPKGAPSAALFTEGNNADWVSEAPASIPAELQGNVYDVVIFDATTGLASIKKNNLDFGLAKVITGGNFHLMGVNTEAKPKEGSKVVAFQKDKIPDKAFKKLCESYYNYENLDIKYVNDVSETAAVLKTGKYQGEAVDYVLSAEPVITSAIASGLDEGVELHRIHNLRADWKTKYSQDAIVQAGVFIRKSSISTKNAVLRDFMAKLESNLETLINEPEKAAEEMNKYSEDLTVQANRFGANANLVKKLQKDGQNLFGFVDPEASIDVNGFLETLGEPTYNNSYFVIL